MRLKGWVGKKEEWKELGIQKGSFTLRNRVLNSLRLPVSQALVNIPVELNPKDNSHISRISLPLPESFSLGHCKANFLF